MWDERKEVEMGKEEVGRGQSIVPDCDEGLCFARRDKVVDVYEQWLRRDNLRAIPMVLTHELRRRGRQRV